MSTNTKRWWLTAIVVPVIVAIIAIIPAFLQKGSASADGTFHVVGTQYNDDVTFNSVSVVLEQARQSGEELPDSVVATLREAVELARAGKFEAAIPLLESAASTIPVPALLNNVGAAYLANGDGTRAREYLERAVAADSNELAAHANLERITKPHAPSRRLSRSRSRTSGAFSDEFDGDELHSAWKVVNEDADRWIQERGSLVIVSQLGSFGGERIDLRNQFVLERALPEDYVVTAKLSMAIRTQHNWGAILIYLDSANYLVLGYWGDPAGGYNVVRTPMFAKVVRGEENRLVSSGQGGALTEPETLWFKLRKEGSSFTGAFTLDGSNWHSIGSHTMVGMEDARLSLTAANAGTAEYGGGAVAETAVAFDFVEVKPLP